MAAQRVRLIHGASADLDDEVSRLEDAGFRVDAGPVATPDEVARLRSRPPTVFVIDVRRAFCQGRDAGVALRGYAETRRVPLVYAGADREQGGRLREILPGVTVRAWSTLPGALAGIIIRAADAVPRPVSVFAGYSGTPLVKKLGIKASSVVVLVRAPEVFEAALGSLPAGVTLRRRNQGARDLTLWFTSSKRELESGIERMARALGSGRLWICWPKRASALAADHTESDVRRVGLDSGLVDYKICAIDADWSGLLFARRSRAAPTA